MKGNLIKKDFRTLESKLKISIFIFIISSLMIIFNFCIITHDFNKKGISNYSNNKILKTSGWIWATLDFTNAFEVNNSRFNHNSIIIIEGRLYNRMPGGNNKSDCDVELEVDYNPTGIINTTDSQGKFSIDYKIDPSLDVYLPHIITAKVISGIPTDPPDAEIEYRHHYIINVSTTSYFDVQDPPSASLHGEFFNFDGYLNFQNGMGISNAFVNYYWYNGSNIVDSGSFWTNGLGEIPHDLIFVPFFPEDDLTLKLNYSDSPYVNYSQVIITNTKIFTDISCIWNLPSTITENSNLNIAGQLLSSTDPSVVISRRDIEIYFNGSFIGTDTTDSNGDFSYIYPLPAGLGLSSLRIVLIGSGLETTQFIDVEAQQPSGPSTPGEAPFFMFLAIILPILAVVIAGLSFYGYRYYKKQDKLSRVVDLPLESKIINLKILKDSGRLEESLSYLFNAIYMDLVDAKFGRTREINETIRDFAIISVKDLKLNPTTIYPFIQKIEQIIYAKPFQISDSDFYKTVELFSPIYLQLTGYNFVLNF